MVRKASLIWACLMFIVYLSLFCQLATAQVNETGPSDQSYLISCGRPDRPACPWLRRSWTNKQRNNKQYSQVLFLCIFNKIDDQKLWFLWTRALFSGHTSPCTRSPPIFLFSLASLLSMGPLELLAFLHFGPGLFGHLPLENVHIRNQPLEKFYHEIRHVWAKFSLFLNIWTISFVLLGLKTTKV